MTLIHRSQNICNISFIQAALSIDSRPSIVSFKTFNKRKQAMISYVYAKRKTAKYKMLVVEHFSLLNIFNKAHFNNPYLRKTKSMRC
jgi:hypothetical protein